MNSVLILLYLGGVFYGLKTLAFVVGLFTVGIFFKFVEDAHGDDFKKATKWCVAIVSICLMFVIFLPSRATMYTAAAAEFSKNGVSEIVSKELADGIKAKIMKALEE